MPTHTEEERRRRQRERLTQQLTGDARPTATPPTTPQSRADRIGVAQQLGFGTSETGQRYISAMKNFVSPEQPAAPAAPPVVAGQQPQQEGSIFDRVLRAGEGGITRDGATTQFTPGELQERARSVNTADLTGSTAELQRANAIRNQGTGGAAPTDQIRERLLQRFQGGGIGSRAALEGLLKLEDIGQAREASAATASGRSLANQLRAGELGISQQGLELKQGQDQRAQIKEATEATFSALQPEIEGDDEGRSRSARAVKGIADELLAAGGGGVADANSAILAAELLGKTFSEATGQGIFDFSGPDLVRSLSQARGLTLVYDTDQQGNPNKLEQVEFQDPSGKTFKTNIDPGFFQFGGISGADAGGLVSLMRRFNQNVNIRTE